MFSTKIPLGKRSLRRTEAILMSGFVRFEDRVDVGRRLLWIDLDHEKLVSSVVFCDIAIPGVCSGPAVSTSGQMSEKDLEYLFGLPEGTRVEVIIRRQCGG